MGWHFVYLILLYSDHLTVENHLVLVCVDMHNNDVISFQTSFFVVFIYESRSVLENRENLHPVKISHYAVVAK